MTGPQYFRTSADEAAAYVESALLDAASSTSTAIPALGDVVTMTVGTSKEFTPGSIWKFAAVSNAANNFNLLVQSYSSGDVTGVCIVTNGSGTYASWSAAHIAAPTGDANVTAFTSTSITVPTTASTISFTTQTGRSGFYAASLGYLVSLDGTKVIYGQFAGNYNSGTGAWAINPLAAVGSGSSSSWKVVVQTPPLTPAISGTATPGIIGSFSNGNLTVVNNAANTAGVNFYVSPGGTSFYSLTIAMGAADRTLTFAGNATISGTNTGDAGPMTTRGDILYMNSTPAAARLAIGAANTYLKSDGTDVSWGTNPAAWTTATGTLTSGTTLDIAIPATANEFFISWEGLSHDNGSNRYLQIQILTAAATPDSTAGNYMGVDQIGNLLSHASMLGTNTGRAAASTWNGNLDLRGLLLASARPIRFSSVHHDGTTGYLYNGYWNGTGQAYGIRFLLSGAGNFDATAAGNYSYGSR